MENIKIKEININVLIETKGEENLTKFDKKNITKYLDGKISFNQLIKRLLNDK